ncbi:VOC family protein [Kitasatospora sp. NBC_00374]|uniref:VOC family protein n=1 Tax=Kitasatospora sp. NBC_00374 TaxID=2975964 RepID=UPI00352D685A
MAEHYVALNGGPLFPFTEAISLQVDWDQAEVDRLWAAPSWPITPRRLMELLGDPDPARAQRVTRVMLQMRKTDIQAL